MVKRSPRKPPPAPHEIGRARQAAGLTKTQAGALLYTSYRVWEQWESGQRTMHPVFFEFFLIMARRTGEGGRQDEPV